ncbi:outer membrane protein OmpK [Spongiibacter taiwanensis]
MPLLYFGGRHRCGPALAAACLPWLLLSPGAGAEELEDAASQAWSSTALSVLHGKAEVVSDEAVWNYRLEHLSSDHRGMVFVLLEHLRDNRDYEESYMELVGRLSLGNLSGRKLSVGPVSDVHLAFTEELGRAPDYDFNNHLYGLGLDIAVPGLDYFQTNVFYADNEYGQADVRLELVYGRVFELGNQVLIIDGLADWSSAEADKAASFRFNPQLRMDVGRWWGLPPRSIEAGIEYSWWHNKYGLKNIAGLDTDESAVSLLLMVYLQ